MNLRMMASACVWMALGSGCPGGSGGDEGTGTTGEPGSTGGGTTSGTTGGTGSGTSGTGEPTTGATGTTGGPVSSTGAAETGSTTGGSMYCQGFDASAPAPFLELQTMGGQPLAGGVTWPLECGGQGIWMFGLYPSFGGWEPMDQIVYFDITVDVEGYNTNPDGHFYSAEMTIYYIGCDVPDGGVVGVIPVFPLDSLADLTVLDGLPAKIHVVVDAGGQPVAFDGEGTLAVDAQQVMNGCGFG